MSYERNPSVAASLRAIADVAEQFPQLSWGSAFYVHPKSTKGLVEVVAALGGGRVDEGGTTRPLIRCTVGAVQVTVFVPDEALAAPVRVLPPIRSEVMSRLAGSLLPEEMSA